VEREKRHHESVESDGSFVAGAPLLRFSNEARLELGGPEGGHDAFLGGFHGGALGRIGVFVACEVEQAVNKVSEELAGEGFPVFAGLTEGDGGTDDNFPVVEGNDVGRAIDVHEVLVDAGAGFVIDEGDLQRGEQGERSVRTGGVGKGEVGGLVGDVFEGGQPAFRDLGGFLVVADDDFEGHGKAFDGKISGPLGHGDDAAALAGIAIRVEAFGRGRGSIVVFRIVDAAVKHAAQGVGEAFLDGGQLLKRERAIIELAILDF